MTDGIMAEIKIRNLDPVILKKIDEMAKKKNLSREEYLRRYLTKISELEDVIQLDEKYANLVAVLSDRMEQANEIIEVNTMILEKVSQKLSEW